MRLRFVVASLAATTLVACGQTDFATEIGATEATLNAHGDVRPGEGAVWFEYWPTADPGQVRETPHRSAPVGTVGALKEHVTGLAANATYSFRACQLINAATRCVQTRKVRTGVGDVMAWGRTESPFFVTFFGIQLVASEGRGGGLPSGRGAASASLTPTIALGDYGSDNVTCVRVEGHQATIGLIGHTPDGTPRQDFALLTDNGPAGSGRDTFAIWPQPPSTIPPVTDCPLPYTGLFADQPQQPVVGGDVVISDPTPQAAPARGAAPSGPPRRRRPAPGARRSRGASPRRPEADGGRRRDRAHRPLRWAGAPATIALDPDRGGRRMTRSRSLSPSATARTDFDVLIVGAGISGIGAAYHLQTRCPGKTFAILEARATRSAARGTSSATRASARTRTCTRSATRFKPWTSDKSIADGRPILDYLRETVAEHGLDRHIRFGHKVVGGALVVRRRALDGRRAAQRRGERVQLTLQLPLRAHRLLRLRRRLHARVRGPRGLRGAGRAPAVLAGRPRLRRQAVVIIGSGATAVTILPAMAATAAHVTMLQRSPSYVLSLPGAGPGRQRPAAPARPASAPTRSRAARTSSCRARSTSSPARPRGSCAADPHGRRQAPLPAGSRRHALQPDATTPGISALPGPRRRPLRGPQRRQRLGRHRPHRALHARRGSG